MGLPSPPAPSRGSPGAPGAAATPPPSPTPVPRTHRTPRLAGGGGVCVGGRETKLRLAADSVSGGGGDRKRGRSSHRGPLSPFLSPPPGAGIGSGRRCQQTPTSLPAAMPFYLPPPLSSPPPRAPRGEAKKAFPQSGKQRRTARSSAAVHRQAAHLTLWGFFGEKNPTRRGVEEEADGGCSPTPAVALE